jgi:hypothetical protein
LIAARKGVVREKAVAREDEVILVEWVVGELWCDLRTGREDRRVIAELSVETHELTRVAGSTVTGDRLVVDNVAFAET